MVVSHIPDPADTSLPTGKELFPLADPSSSCGSVSLSLLQRQLSSCPVDVLVGCGHGKYLINAVYGFPSSHPSLRPANKTLVILPLLF